MGERPELLGFNGRCINKLNAFIRFRVSRRITISAIDSDIVAFFDQAQWQFLQRTFQIRRNLPEFLGFR